MVPIDEVLHFDVTTRGSSGVTDADSAPTYDVFEEATDTPILDDQTMTKRTSLTGNYRGSFTASAANGFEAGKWYSVIVTATVGGTTDKTVALLFRVAPAESQAGVPKVDLSHWLGVAPLALTAQMVQVSVGAMQAAVLTAAAIAADAITAAKIAADAITSAKIADGALTAAKFAAGAFDAVWSVAARTLTAFDNSFKTGYALSAAGVQAIWDALTSALSTANSIGKLLVDNINATISSRLAASSDGSGFTAVPWNAAWDSEFQSEVQDAIEANHLDHLLAVDYDPAAKPGVATALLNELVENDGGVSRYTANALEQAPGSGGSTDWTADERTAIRAILGVPASGSTPDDPSAGILDAIRDRLPATLDTGRIRAVVEAYAAGLDPATQILLVPANKISANSNGQVQMTGTSTGIVLSSSVGVGSTATDVILSAAAGEDYTGHVLFISNAAAPFSVVGAQRIIAYNVGTKTATVETAFSFTPTNGTHSANVKYAGGKVDYEIKTLVNALNDLDAAGIRTALGLATANLDLQLDALPTAAEIAAATGLRQIVESYKVAGAAPTLDQVLMEILQNLTDFAIAGTTKTAKKLDGTTAKTYTLDSSSAPTSITEAT